MWTDSRITKLEKIWKSLPAWRFACSVEKSVWCSPLVLAHLFLESQGNILLSRAGREKMRLTKLLLVVVWSDFGLGDVNPTKVKPWEWKKKKKNQKVLVLLPEVGIAKRQENLISKYHEQDLVSQGELQHFYKHKI